jgi:hypothetical protein
MIIISDSIFPNLEKYKLKKGGFVIKVANGI